VFALVIPRDLPRGVGKRIDHLVEAVGFVGVEHEEVVATDDAVAVASL
jgi:hypothetical protein